MEESTARFPLLVFYCTVLEIIGWTAIFVGGVVALVALSVILLHLPNNIDRDLASFDLLPGGLGLLFGGVFTGAVAELLRVFVAIEEHARVMAAGETRRPN
jgi:hypothetical protein